MTTQAPQSTPNSKKTKFTPVLNKLFMNKLRGLIEEEYAFRNVDKTKKDLFERYGVPNNSKLYNYKQAETRRICQKYAKSLPAQAKRDVKEINKSMFKGLTSILMLGFAYYGGAYYIKRNTKWGRLTSSGLFQKALVYCVLLNTTNYFLLVRNSEQLDIFFKHHAHYQLCIDKYEEDVPA